MANDARRENELPTSSKKLKATGIFYKLFMSHNMYYVYSDHRARVGLKIARAYIQKALSRFGISFTYRYLRYLISGLRDPVMSARFPLPA